MTEARPPQRRRSNRPHPEAAPRGQARRSQPYRAHDYLRDPSLGREQGAVRRQQRTVRLGEVSHRPAQHPMASDVQQGRRAAAGPSRSSRQAGADRPRSSQRPSAHPAFVPRPMATASGPALTGRRKGSLLPIAGILAVIALIAFLALGRCSAPEAPLAETAPEAAPEPISFTLSFAGDCTLGTDEAFDQSTSFNTKFSDVGDPSYFFANVRSLFEADDATIVNMEGVLTEGDERDDKVYAFKGDPSYAQVLTAGGVQAASVANNHSRDYGEQSREDTISVLESAGIATFGYDRVAYLDVKGVKVGLIGVSNIEETVDAKAQMLAGIQAAQGNGAQLIVVMPHWGIEREYVPTAEQMELARAAIDAGAHLVVGSHPHVVQGWERYRDRYIVYSLGNFCFGGNPNPEDKDCMIFQQTFTVAGNDVWNDEQMQVIPCSISSVSTHNNYQPTPAEGEERERIEGKIRESCDAIAAAAASLDA